MRARARLVMVLAASALQAVAVPQAAQPEYELKARFLLQFPEFVSWPRSSGMGDPARPFVILVLGDSPFGARLDQAAAGRKVQGHPVEVRYSRDPAALDGCQMVFICGDQRNLLDALVARAAARSVLTVADMEGSAARGVMINLVIESSLPRFEINRGAAGAASLSLNAQLLGLARKVY
ncbi:MAG TPA: YfiR family protein [Holophagaceae bacterium]|jgi:hypothetical protein|nr:YfiR family protein [Holophagaceae bacterium]